VLAASKDDEPALELGQHGLFTRALLDAIAEADGAVDAGALMPDVALRVAAEAARFGESQTPVWAGLIEGGLSLPALRPGPRYAEAFPDTTGIRVGTDIGELAAFGLPVPLLEAWAIRYPNGLNALQLTAVNDLRVLDGQSALVVAPTTAGKTFVGELAAAKALADGRKAVFLLPYRALVNEKYEDFQALYGDGLGLRVVRCTGDYADEVDAFVRGKYDVALLTFEMFLQLSVGTPSVLPKIGLVVLDEAQFVTDETRGINVELLLTNLLAARERGVSPQIVALSAVIGDVNAFDEWLGCRAHVTTERPVPLIEGVLDRSGVFQYLTPDWEEATEQLLGPFEVVQRKSKASSQDVIVPLVRKLVGEGEHVIVFRNTRGAVAGCANYLAQEMGLPPAHEVIAALPTEDRSGASHSLERALRGGAALHSTDLNREERLAVERAFRDPDGPVRALAATSTVAAGVNTPATTVVIVETFFYGADGQTPYSVAGYKNMAGRAGRLGIAEFGRSVLLADNAFERQALFDQYARASPEPMRSSFTSADLGTWILRLLAQVRSVGEGEVARLLANTYGGYLATRRDPSWRAAMEGALDDLLRRMGNLGLVETEAGHLQLSLLGRVCGASSLAFSSIERLLERLRGPLATGLTAERLMAVVQALPEMDDTYTPLFKKGTKESQWQRAVTERLGMETTLALQRAAPDQLTYWGRCKRTAILLDWIEGISIEDIEKRFSITPFGGSVSAGNVRSIADATRFRLRSAFDIADALLAGEGPDEDEAARLLAQLETGLPATALGLLQLPVRLTRGRALALHAAGLSTVAKIERAGHDTLSAIVGVAYAERLRDTLAKAA
jgi:replicative superfamily II helicase